LIICCLTSSDLYLATFTSLQTSNHVGENVKKVNQRPITAVYWELHNYK